MKQLKSYLGLVQSNINQFLSEHFDQKISEAKEVDEDLVDMYRHLKDFTLAGGKRLRPLLIELSSQLTKEVASEMVDPDRLLRLQAAVELHHFYLLNLDDVIDRDELRHSQPTLPASYRKERFKGLTDAQHQGISLSLVAGALLSGMVMELLSQAKLSSSGYSSVLQLFFDRMFCDTATGWQIQYLQNYQDLDNVSEEKFLKGLELVTSSYTFVGPLLLGFLSVCQETNLSQKQQELKKILSQLGLQLGIIYQLKDDYLGMFGDEVEMGKPVANDLREGKKTILVLKAYQAASAQDRQILIDSLHKPLTQAQLERVRGIVRETGALDYSDSLMRQAFDRCSDLCQSLKDGKEKEIILELAEYLLNRKS